MEDKKSSLEIISPNLPKELDMLSIFNKCILSEDSFTMGIISNGLCENQNADHVSFNKVQGHVECRQRWYGRRPSMVAWPFFNKQGGKQMLPALDTRW